MDSALQLIANQSRPALKIGTRVFHPSFRTREGNQHGGWTGTIIGLPPELAGGRNGVPRGLYAVLRDDDGELYGLAPEALEVCEGAVDHGLQVAVKVLDEKRERLAHDLTCLLAASQRANLADPKTRMQIEAEVEKMTADWSSADAAAMRRKEFFEKPELRSRFIKSLSSFIETGDLIRQIMELIDGDAGDVPGTDGTSPVDAGALPGPIERSDLCEETESHKGDHQT